MNTGIKTARAATRFDALATFAQRHALWLDRVPTGSTAKYRLVGLFGGAAFEARLSTLDDVSATLSAWAARQKQGAI